MPVVNARETKEFDVYIGRGSRWGNPYSHDPNSKAEVIVDTREQAIELFRRDLWDQIRTGEMKLIDLAWLDGKTLGCYCHPLPCHGEVLLAAAKWAKQELARQRSQRFVAS